MANARPEIVRPTCVVVLALRLEDWGDDGELIARLPAGPSSQSGAEQPTPAPQATDPQLVAQLQELDEHIATWTAAFPGDRETLDRLNQQRADLTAQLGQTEDTTASDSLESLSGPAPDDRVIVLQFEPTSCSIEINDFRTADECTISIAWRDVPVDPRLVRAAYVSAIIGIVDPADFERGMRGERREAPAGADQGALFSFVQANGRNTRRFDGVVDNIGDAFDGSSGNEVTLRCRDFTALAIDTTRTQRDGIDLSLPLDQGVQQFLRSYPVLAGVNVRYYGSPDQPTTDAPVPATAAPLSTRTRARGGRGTSRQHRATTTNETLWDHVTDTCVRCGLIPLWSGFELRLVDPRTFYRDRQTAAVVILGQYLSMLEIERRLGGTGVPTFEVRSYNPDTGRVLWARYPVVAGERSAGVLGQTDPPQRPTRANQTGVSGWRPNEHIRTILVRGVTDQDVLRRIARQAFEQIGRQELEGRLKTFVTSSRSDQALDTADMLSVNTGDAIEVLVAGAPGAPASQVAAMSVAEIAAMEVSRRADYLVRIGWARSVAQTFARQMQVLAGQTIFRVNGATITFDAESGIEVEVEICNYIQIREDAQSTETNGTPSPVATASVPNAPASVTEPLVAAQAQMDALASQRADGVITQEEYDRRSAELQQQLTEAWQSQETV